MSQKHKVTINVTNPYDRRKSVVRSKKRSIRSKVLDFILGEQVGLLVVAPGECVKTVEIHEMKEGGDRSYEN